MIQPADSASRPPLQGVRVLDLTRLLPGPVCTLHLADLGADVIKIEDTGAGDYAAPALRALVHRNKRAMCLDLKKPQGVDVLHRLVRTADVLVESFRPGVTGKLGADYETLARINPKLVYCSITGYGQTGPYRNEPGHDLNYCALAGASDQIGRPGDPPAMSNVPIADLLGGSLTSLAGLLAALFDAGRTGLGRHVDIAMADSMLAHTLVPMVTLATHGHTRPAGTDKLSGGLPCYAIYRTQDGRQLAVGALERKFWDRFCDLIARPDLKDSHRPATQADTDAVHAEVAALVASRPLSHWVDLFRDGECCVSPVLRLEEALDNPQFNARGMVVSTQGQRQFGCPIKMSGYQFQVRNPAPARGEHTSDILAEAGYDAASRAALRAEGVV